MNSLDALWFTWLLGCSCYILINKLNINGLYRRYSAQAKVLATIKPKERRYK